MASKSSCSDVQLGCQQSIRGICIALLVLLVAASAGKVEAGDQSYQSLRDWIDQYRSIPPDFKPGDKLTEQDRQALEPFIPQTAWDYYFYDGMQMEMAATGHYPPPDNWGEHVLPGFVIEDDVVLTGFTGGGFPYPEILDDDPQAALKVIWNHQWRPGDEGYSMPMVSWLTSEGGRINRVYEFNAEMLRYARGDHSFVPGYEEIKSKMLMEFRSPRDLAGAKMMSKVYVDHRREDDGWMYMPSQRKPRRTLASERTSEVMGMDYTMEDMMGFGGKVYEHDWTYLGRKPVVATINVRDNPEAGGPNKWVPKDARWEVRAAHVLLIDPKSSSHPYSHKIVFIDTETFWTHWMFAFDRQDDNLLRMNQHFLKYSESYDEDEVMQAPFIKLDYSNNLNHNVFIHLGETDINPKKPHATFSHCYVMLKDMTAGRAKQYFSLRNMVSGRR